MKPQAGSVLMVAAQIFMARNEAKEGGPTDRYKIPGTDQTYLEAEMELCARQAWKLARAVEATEPTIPPIGHKP